jgi:ferrous iron transport protein B
MTASASLSPLRVALVGAPNAGKTTLFNALTGARAKVANYPGVTVERREGALQRSARPVAVLDLPGTYSLAAETPDEAIATAVVDGTQRGEAVPDALVVVTDATSLARGLGLVAQVLAHERPTVLVLTMLDEVRARGGWLDLPKLARILGIPVLGVIGNRGIGVGELRELLQDPAAWSRPLLLPPSSEPAERFAWVDAVVREVSRAPQVDRRTAAIDRVLLHPVAGVAVFAGVMVLLFQSIFSFAVPAMDAIDAAIRGLAGVASAALPAGALRDLLTDGVLAGVGSVLVFVPQIAILFALIHLLEATGYMARAAFVVDRAMGLVGLQGRCFVSLLSSYACAIPGIMAARSIASPRERLTTIMVAPFMTCSARLPVYTLLIAAFVPATKLLGPIGLQGVVMLGLYLLGSLTALATAALVGTTLLRGEVSRFYLELPPYRWPRVRVWLLSIWRSVLAFVKRAGSLILALSVLLWALLHLPHLAPDPALTPAENARAQLEQSLAARLGHAVEPAIAPLGFDWKIGVGLVASLAAREVIVATLAQIYAVGDADDFEGLRHALAADIDPRTGASGFTLPVALSLLVFFVFALQCTSTIVVMARETGSWRWPALAFTYMFALAYGASFLTYRLALSLLA